MQSEVTTSHALSIGNAFKSNGFNYEVLDVNKKAVLVRAFHTNGHSLFHEVWIHTKTKRDRAIPGGHLISSGTTIKPSNSNFSDIARCFMSLVKARAAFDKLKSGVKLSKI